jgi:Ca2+/Na+ antiporter
MLPKSRVSWSILNGGIFGLCSGLLVWMGFAAQDAVIWVMIGLSLALFAFVFFVSRAEREEEEKSERSDVELAAPPPLEALGQEIEDITCSLLRWTTWLAGIAFAVAVLTMVGGCSGGPSEARQTFFSALTWLALAVTAWYVRDRASRSASLVLLLVPLANLVANGVAIARSQLPVSEWFPSVCMPLFFCAVAVKCCLLTFKYHRHLRLDG